MIRPRPLLALLALLALALGAASVSQPAAPAGERWWKGNTHTHTLWSDGDGAPELVAAFYRERDYDFLVLSDHNVLSAGERWFPIGDEGARLSEARVTGLRERFGAGAGEVREREGVCEMRLLTLAELRARFEEDGEFLFIQGEEVTDRYEQHEVHINALNLHSVIPPQGGDSVADTIQSNLDAILAHSEETGEPVLAHVNHPNFQWSLTAEDLATIRGERFFEVYNGHPGVRNQGDADHPSTERMWDLANTLRTTTLDLPLLYGLATDDSHHYHAWGPGRVNPGRGWVMVRAEELSARALLDALHAGEFYASSGVRLADVSRSDGAFSIQIDGDEGVRYRTEFVGTRRAEDGPGPVGEILATFEGPRATYRFRGDELFVRARVISDRPHPNPQAAGDVEMAWVQPVRP